MADYPMLDKYVVRLLKLILVNVLALVHVFVTKLISLIVQFVISLLDNSQALRIVVVLKREDNFFLLT